MAITLGDQNKKGTIPERDTEGCFIVPLLSGFEPEDLYPALHRLADLVPL